MPPTDATRSAIERRNKVAWFGRSLEAGAIQTAMPDPTTHPIVVADFEAADRAVRSGTDSSQLVILAGQDEAAAMASARAGLEANRGPVPTAPFSFGLRNLVVVPTFDERDNVGPITEAILAYLDTDVLIVDDASPDGTGELADALAAANPRIHVLHRQGKQGLGTAYIAGFRWAHARGYERVFEMDADFSHPPWDLPRLCHASLGADLVLGSRYVAGGDTVGWDFRRRLLSKGANLYARMCLWSGIRDMTGGFRCFRTDRLMQLALDEIHAQGYAFQIEMAFRMKRKGFRVVEVPIHFTDRRVGESKMDGSIAREALMLVPKLRFRV